MGMKHNHINIDDKLIEILDGELLGDGSIQPVINNGKFTSAYYNHGSKYKEYLIWLNKLTFNLDCNIKINEEKNGNFKYSAKSYVEIKDFYNKWYLKDFSFCPHCEIILHDESVNKYLWVNKRRCPICYNHYLFKKVVPNDLKLTPTVLLHWYIGDGSLKHRDGAPRGISLATCAFLKRDVEFLKLKLQEIGIICHIWKGTIGDSYQIDTSKSSLLNFFRYIGNCPKEIRDIYGYKWPTHNEFKSLRDKLKFETNANDTYRNREWLYHKYWIEGLTLMEISKLCNMGDSRLSYWMKSLKIPVRKRKDLCPQRGIDGRFIKSERALQRQIDYQEGVIQNV